MVIKHFRVRGDLTLYFDKIVTAKTEKEAMRKARNSVIKNQKLKPKHFDKENCQVWEI